MFANFKVTQAGAGSTRATKRHKRSIKGCQACRHRRKKCDERKPVCGRCDRHPATFCLWDDGQRELQQSMPQLVASHHMLPSLSHSPQLCLASYITPAHFPSAEIAEASVSQIELLIQTFNYVFCVSFVDPRYSIIFQGMPYAIQQPGLMHAYAACGAAILSKSDSKWERVSLSHYSKAIKSVSENLTLTSSICTTDQTCLLATMNILHIFETLFNDKFRPNTLHLAAARRLCDDDIFPVQHFSSFARSVLAEYVFAITIASTFHSFCFGSRPSFFHISRLLERLYAAETNCGVVTNVGQVANPIDHARPLFDWIFRLSYLRMHIPLSGQELLEARAVLAYLETWKPPSSTPGDACQFPTKVAPPNALLMAELYRSAALILAHKVLEPSLTAEDMAIQSSKRRGMEILAAISEPQLRDASVFIWPIFILGLSATSVQDKNSCQRPLEYLFRECSIGCTRGILNLLTYAWESESTRLNQAHGLDILFQDNLLSQAVF